MSVGMYLLFSQPVTTSVHVGKAEELTWVAGHSAYTQRVGNVMQHIPAKPAHYIVSLKIKKKVLVANADESIGRKIKKGETARFTIQTFGIQYFSPTRWIVEVRSMK